MVTLELNENQSQVLVQLLDLAVKAGGLNVAKQQHSLQTKSKNPNQKAQNLLKWKSETS